MVGDNDEKLVCQSFHLTGIDGNPLVSASIHIRYVERRREGINIATDIITTIINGYFYISSKSAGYN